MKFKKKINLESISETQFYSILGLIKSSVFSYFYLVRLSEKNITLRECVSNDNFIKLFSSDIEQCENVLRKEISENDKGLLYEESRKNFDISCSCLSHD